MALIASGRTADVVDLGDGRVLRRYRDSHHDVVAEAELMRYLHDVGFPVPEVHAASGTDLVMTRVAGPTLAEAALSGTVSPAEVGHLLADLHRALDPVAPLPPMSSEGAGSGETSERVLHLDLHPENVLLGPDGPVVIDWTNAAAGPRGLDRAVTGLILAEVVVGGDPVFADAVKEALLTFLERTRRPSPDHLAAAVALRRQDPALSRVEIDRLDEAASLLA